MRDMTTGVRHRRTRQPALPDLHTQLEELLIEVWAQERFERKHPFTCAVMRERVHPLRLASTPLN